MRVVYLDESGTSRREPLALVAGVIIDADHQMIAVEERLEQLVRKHIPEADHENFFFHATNIWSGTKYFKDRDVWPLSRRCEILHDLVRIPSQCDLPILFGCCPRNRQLTKSSGAPIEESERDAVVHSIAFLECACRIEKIMRQLWPTEVALLIAEDRPIVRKTLRQVQSWAQNKTVPHEGEEREYLPFRHIRDTPHFAGKKESPLLQLADICAFVIRGHLNERRHNRPLYDKLRPMMVVHPKADDESSD